MERICPGSIQAASSAELARNTRAVASHRSVRRASSRLKGTRLLQKDRGRRGRNGIRAKAPTEKYCLAMDTINLAAESPTGILFSNWAENQSHVIFGIAAGDRRNQGAGHSIV